MFDVLGRITELKEERGWTSYRLAKNADIPQSSLATWYSKKISPPVDAIEKICRACDVSLSEFFDENKEPGIETSLYKIRQRSGLSQQELAEKADMPKELLNSYENNKKDITNAQFKVIMRLADVLGCTVEEIVGDK